MNDEIEIADAPIEYLVVTPGEFVALPPEEKLDAMYALAYADHLRMDGALSIIDEIGSELGPILETMQANPMFKMMGFGKRL